MKWYVTWVGDYSANIKAVEVEKFTATTVTLRNGRRNRYGKFDSYFPTFEEAKQHLIKKGEEESAKAYQKCKEKDLLLEKYRSLECLEVPTQKL